MAEKTITLVKGIKVKNEYLKILTVREPTVGDMVAVEEQDGVASYLAVTFKRALIARCTVDLQGYKGVVTPSMLDSVSYSDWLILVDGFNQAGQEGKPEDASV